VNGFPITTLSQAVAQGATSISVADTTGIVAGQTWMTIEALDTSFIFLAGAVSTAGSNGIGTGPGTVVCSAVPRAITATTPYPIMVTSLPEDAIEACTLIVRALIKMSGGGNLAGFTSAAGNVGGAGGGNSPIDDMTTAEAMLRPYIAPVA
jgi:hypothetical protein